jgi:hypothetical protein
LIARPNPPSLDVILFKLLVHLTSYALPPLFQVFLETSAVVFVVAYIPGVSEPQAFVHIAVAFVALIPACVLVFEVDIPERPRFFVLPKICSFANSSSSAEVADRESVDSSTDARTNYGFCSNLSNVDLR